MLTAISMRAFSMCCFRELTANESRPKLAVLIGIEEPPLQKKRRGAMLTIVSLDRGWILPAKKDWIVLWADLEDSMQYVLSHALQQKSYELMLLGDSRGTDKGRRHPEQRFLGMLQHHCKCAKSIE